MTGLFGGQLIPDVEVFGQHVDAWAQPVADEVERRFRLRLGPIVDVDVVQALMGIPADTAVPLASLDPIMQLILTDAGLASGAVELAGPGVVVRQAIPPLHLVGLIKHARCWADVQAATLLRTHAPRVVVTESQELAHRVLRRTDLDLGVALQESGGELQVVRPPGRRWLCPSWQRWILIETAYARGLGQGLLRGLRQGVGPRQQ